VGGAILFGGRYRYDEPDTTYFIGYNNNHGLIKIKSEKQNVEYTLINK